VPHILHALSDDKSLSIFDWVIREDVRSKIIIKRLKLTPKQYYSRLSALMNSGVIEKTNGKYRLTSLGGVVHEALQLIESGVNYYWKLKAIDSIAAGLSDQERNKIVERLIDKQELRELVLRKLKQDRSKE
jgi:predicted transcriptional regulator